MKRAAVILSDVVPYCDASKSTQCAYSGIPCVFPLTVGEIPRTGDFAADYRLRAVASELPRVAYSSNTITL